MNQVLIQVKNLYFAYERHLVLKNINLEVKKGDFLAIIGPNGGGKSTLIKCILGFLKPLKGEIRLWGKRIKEFKDWYKIGYVPQRAGELIDTLTPLTVKEFLSMPAKWYHKKINTQIRDFLIEKFGVKEFLNKKLGELSYGQLQRAYIIRALILEPEVLILDEPSVGLDFFSQDAFYHTLGEFYQKGLTILLITHETWLLTKWVNKVACVNQSLFFHGTHESFCVLSKQKEFFSDYHKIEHLHW
jgi:zinc transport system ATP-binding protein